MIEAMRLTVTERRLPVADEVGEAFFQKIVGLTNLMFGLGMFFFFRKNHQNIACWKMMLGFFCFFCSFFFQTFSMLGGIFVKMGPERFGGGLKDEYSK